MRASHRDHASNNDRAPRNVDFEYASLGASTDGWSPRLDLTAGTYNRALRDIAHEELAIVRRRYTEHGDPVRCAVGISLVLRTLAENLFGEQRIERLTRVSWLNFLSRTSNEELLRPDFIETMSAALYDGPVGDTLPHDCSLWFDAAAAWIDHQRDRHPMTACETPLERNV